VIAVEPTPDTLAVLRRNIAASGLGTISIAPVAAGSADTPRDLFLRGGVSAVNSLFPDSRYAEVTGVVTVPVVPLDTLVDGTADVVKIDVEGAEIEVLEGMPRLLAASPPTLVIEWDPTLQRLAGHAPDALPRWLLARGWRLTALSHLGGGPLPADRVPLLTDRLLRRQGLVELLAQPPPNGRDAHHKG
jgi:FkbM family methyltransferase